MLDEFKRTELVFGRAALQKIQSSTVAIFGVGGVGSFVAEGIARCGIEHIILVDDDIVNLTNINRQLIALHSTVGKPKVEAMRDRILDINPNALVEVYNKAYTVDNYEEFDLSECDYIVDAIDTVTSKIKLIIEAQRARISIISSMGTGNKLDPTRLEISDIYKTSVCPLAKVMRKELKARGVEKLKVLYSKEEPIEPKEEYSLQNEIIEVRGKRKTVGSVSFVPSVAGLIIAGEVIKDLAR